MKVLYSPEAQQDIYEWAKENAKILDRIDKLVDDIVLDPYKGIGKPEPLKHKYSGYWSRRIDNKHRLIYRVLNNDTIEITRCKGHYDAK